MRGRSPNRIGGVCFQIVAPGRRLVARVGMQDSTNPVPT
jgi:hypothetical protein